MNPTGQPRLLAEYAEPGQLVSALRRLRAAGCESFEVFTPFPSEEIDELLPGKPTPVGWLMLAGGIAGGSGAYWMQWYAAHDYAYNVGGRPLHSWPAFVPVTFELTVLTAALTGFFSLLWLARLPRLDHPVLSVPEFVRASQDRFFVAVAVGDTAGASPKIEIERLLRTTSPASLQEVSG